MEEPYLDKERVDAGIEQVCACLDSLGLTLFERWYVCRCIEKSAAGIMGESFAEAARDAGL